MWTGQEYPDAQAHANQPHIALSGLDVASPRQEDIFAYDTEAVLPRSVADDEEVHGLWTCKVAGAVQHAILICFFSFRPLRDNGSYDTMGLSSYLC